MVATIGDSPERWPLRQPDGDRAGETALAAQMLGVGMDKIAEDEDWLTILGIK